ncbi:hypothetical protein Tco_0967477 [Tanacetum coccineum]
MFNDVKLQVDYECEMAFELLRLVKKQLKEGYGRIVGIKILLEVIAAQVRVTAAKQNLVLFSNLNEKYAKSGGPCISIIKQTEWVRRRRWSSGVDGSVGHEVHALLNPEIRNVWNIRVGGPIVTGVVNVVEG